MADVEVSFGAQTEELVASMAQIREVLQGLTNPLRAVKDNLGEVAEAFVAAFAIERLSEWVDSMAELGEKTLAAAASVGMATEQFSQLAGIMNVFGVDTDMAGHTMERLERSMEMAQTGTGRQALAFEALGISQKQIQQGMQDMPGFLDLLRQRWQAYADDASKSANFFDIMGRSFDRLVPYLRQTDDEVARTKQDVADTGSVLDSTMAEAMEHTSQKVHLFGEAMKGVSITMFGAFHDAIDTVLDDLTKLVEGFNNAARGSGTTNQSLAVVVDLVDDFIAAIETITKALEQLWQVVSVTVDHIVNFASVTGQMMKDLASGSFEKMGEDAATWYEKSKARQEAYVKDSEAIWDGFAEHLAHLHDNIKYDPQTGLPMGVDTSGKLPEITVTGDREDQNKPHATSGQELQERLKEAAAEAQAELAIAKARYAEEEEAAKEAYTNGTMSVEQYAQAQRDAEDEMYAATLKSLNSQLAAADQNKVQRIKLEGEIAAAKEAHNTKLMQIDQQYYTQSTKLAEQAADQQIATNNKQLQTNEAMLTQQYTLGQIDFNQKIDLMRQYEQSTFESNQRRLEDLLSTLGKETQAWQQYHAKLEQLEQAHALKMIQLDQQQFAAMEHDIQGFTDTFAHTFTSSIMGLVEGTETLQQAIAKIFDAMLEHIISFLMEWASKWAATQIANLFMSQSTQAEGSAAQMVSDAGSISDDAAVAAAGAYAATAAIPMVGPELAPAAAAEAYAGAMSWMSGLAAFADGAWNIPSTMLATLHADEMVLPAPIASSIRANVPNFAAGMSGAGGAGGGPISVTLQVNALDGPSVARLLNDQRGTIATIVAEGIRNANGSLMGSLQKAGG